MQLRTGSEFARRFVLGNCVGEGPATEVWRATDLASGESRAIKFLSRRVVRDPEKAVQELRELITYTRRIDHPSIVNAEGAVEAEGRLAVVTPWIDGVTLEEKRQRQPRRRFDFDSIRGVVCALAEAMQSAEKLRLFHGALKPTNLMLDQTGELKVTDFGTGAWLATQLGRRKRYGQLASSIPYWSPAQILAGGGSYWRDDTFAFGAILYVLLTGVAPFPKRKLRRESKANLRLGPCGGRWNHIEVPEVLEQVVMMCLESNPAQRPASFRRICGHLDPLRPKPAVVGRKSEILQPASAGGRASTPSEPKPEARPVKNRHVANSDNGHSRHSAPHPRETRQEDVSATQSTTGRGLAGSDETPWAHDRLWYESVMAEYSSEEPTRSKGWLLKTFLAMAALVCVAVAAAFAWIVSGHELLIPWSF